MANRSSSVTAAPAASAGCSPVKGRRVGVGLDVLAIVILVSFVADRSLRVLGGRLSAQSAIGDADLERASGARMVAVRAPAGGAIARLPLEVYVARVLAGEGEPG